MDLTGKKKEEEKEEGEGEETVGWEGKKDIEGVG